MADRVNIFFFFRKPRGIKSQYSQVFTSPMWVVAKGRNINAACNLSYARHRRKGPCIPRGLLYMTYQLLDLENLSDSYMNSKTQDTFIMSKLDKSLARSTRKD